MISANCSCGSFRDARIDFTRRPNWLLNEHIQLNVPVVLLRVTTEHHYGFWSRGDRDDTSETEGDTMRINRKMTTALERARDAQTAYWDALLALEKAIGVEVDGTQDLQDTTVKDLIEQA
jgi:hypothetical protein